MNAPCIKWIRWKNLFYSGSDLWLEMKLHQDLGVLSDSCRKEVEVEFHMF